MKKGFSLAVLAAFLLLTISAFAGDKTVTFSSTMNINGQKVAPGEYRVRYEVKGSTADVHFLHNKKEVATTSAQLVDANPAPTRDSVVTQANADGTSKLVEIQFENQKSVMKFGADTSAGN
jgi:hypothetical protein